MRALYSALCLSLLIPLTGCQDDPTVQAEPEPVRGLKALRIEAQEDASVRRYPSVLQPSDTTQLSFEIKGRLNKIDLNVGQQVSAGEVLASLDQRALKNDVAAARAAVEEARAANANAQTNWKRQEELFAKQLVSVSVRDDARTNALSAQARYEQTSNQLASAETALSKSVLSAPYRGVINSVPVESFANVAPGTVIATLSNPDSFEVNFSVSYEVVTQLSVGKEVNVTLADQPDVNVKARISELSSSAKTVESFPVVVQLTEISSTLKAGMAVEVEVELPLAGGKGYTLPLSA
ncbi:MAG: efflux RND transporter periplasmic adaptor subunit, partial [Pseudomonadota bacterium]|nr:efflux RND transporter periplasmic adaptor subunit [Pseudomonadota bacterium]